MNLRDFCKGKTYPGIFSGYLRNFKNYFWLKPENWKKDKNFFTSIHSAFSIKSKIMFLLRTFKI